MCSANILPVNIESGGSQGGAIQPPIASLRFMLVAAWSYHWQYKCHRPPDTPREIARKDKRRKTNKEDIVLGSHTRVKRNERRRTEKEKDDEECAGEETEMEEKMVEERDVCVYAMFIYPHV